MALSKIELKLGKKVIKLTTDEFEELKRDMRELDKQHHYYWYKYYPYGYGQISQPLTLRDNFYYATGVSNNLSGNLSAAVTIPATTKDLPKGPPSFSGSILSTS